MSSPNEFRRYLRGLSLGAYQRIETYISELPTQPPEWDDARTVSDSTFRLTHDEAKRLREEAMALLNRYRLDLPDVDAPPGTERVVLQIQLLPQLTRNESAYHEPTDQPDR